MALRSLPNRYISSRECLDEILRRNRHLDERDRAFINQLVQGVLRWRLRLDWIIEQAADFPIKKIYPSILNILRLALYQIFFLDRVPQSAAVNEAVKQARVNGPRHVVSFANGILRNICRQKDKIPFPDRDSDIVHYLSVFYSYPEWLIEKWIEDMGVEFTEELLSAGNRIPTLTIRTNSLKLDRSELIKRLGDEGVTGRPVPYSPEGIQLVDFKGRIDELISFREGLFQVQDQAAQITSHLLSPQPGEIIIDLCAGLGGKSTHLAELMGDKGRVLTIDITHKRLISLGKTSRRLGIGSIISMVADATGSLSSLFRNKFDRIMVDAPCSGLGVISRHPDGKWSKSEEDIGRLAILQKIILNEAASVLQKGGKMLYVTCTISREENEEVVNDCLERNRDIYIENLRGLAPEWCMDLIDDQGFLRTFPHLHNMDGFFCALFTRR